MNLTSEVSAWGMLAGGLTWIAFGAVAAAGHIRAPRAWAQLGPRWGWCHLLLGVGLTCFPADALLGDYSAPVLSCLGAVVTLGALVLLLTGRRSVIDDLDPTPGDNRPTYRMPPGPGQQPHGQPVPGQPVPGPPVHQQQPSRQSAPGQQPYGWPAPGRNPYGPPSGPQPYGRPASGPQQPYGRPPAGPQQGRPASGAQPHGQPDPANPHAATRPGDRRFHF